MIAFTRTSHPAWCIVVEAHSREDCVSVCHTDCGPITQINEDGHVHENDDGTCWHDPEDNTP